MKNWKILIINVKNQVIKKLLIFFLLCFYSPIALAGFWGGLLACFSDICNCGVSEKTRYENWDGTRWNKGKKNPICPPWNKDGGRHDNTCLVKAPFPGTWHPYYENLCGEATPDSNYFEPKIRVRGQQCNAFACWTTNSTLGWKGQCVTLIGGYVLPLHRMCARVAMPKDTINNRDADPGYTYGKHLNFEGATKNDEPITTSSGEKIILEPPKLCLYNDPSFFSFSDGLDIMDLHPSKQSFHKTSETHPVIKAIIFFIDNAMALASSPFDLISALFGAIDGEGEDGETTGWSVISDMFAFLGKIIEWMGKVIISLLKEVGQINRAVSDKIYGCVNIPMGPYPPPYCEKVSPYFEAAVTQKICHIGKDYLPAESVDGKECVVSTLRNNYIANSVRVGYENFIPLCTNNEDPLTTDKCVTIENLGPFASAKALHASTARRDIIQSCNTAPSGAICVKTGILHKCNVSENGCQDGFRVVYGTTAGGRTMPRSYFMDDLNDCPNSKSSTCQKVWGINVGQFVDIDLTFPAIQPPEEVVPLIKSVTLEDKEGREAQFTASITRTATFNPAQSFIQEPNQICVIEGDYIVGCESRAPAPQPSIYECGSNIIPGINCSSGYFNPKFIVSYNSDYRVSEDPSNLAKDSTSALLEPASVYNSSTLNSTVNLAGDYFESFVTDDTFTIKPFQGSKSPNPASLYGDYLDNETPIKDNEENPDAIYLKGLEYINDKYHLGGKYACIAEINPSKCPDNPKICVLAKLLNKDTVLCSVLESKSTSHGGLKLCTDTQTSKCGIIDSMPKIGGGTVSIRSCGEWDKCYDGTVELCTLSNLPEDRIDPVPSLGRTLSDSQYYDPYAAQENTGKPIGVSKKYNSDIHGMRDKTAVERGLCVDIPQGSCSAQNDYSKDNGYAAWPAALVSQKVIGTCKPGYSPVKPLQRTCIPDPDTKSFKFEPLYRIIRIGLPNSFYQYKEYTDMKCEEDE